MRPGELLDAQPRSGTGIHRCGAAATMVIEQFHPKYAKKGAAAKPMVTVKAH